MGLFPRFDEEEPERAPDAPRKTGLPRLWQLVRRDLWDNFRAGFLALAGCVPFAVGMIFAVAGRAMLLAPAAGLIGGAVAGPQLCALADTLLRGLRDDVGLVWWRAYRKAWRRSAKAALLPGALGEPCWGLSCFSCSSPGSFRRIWRPAWGWCWACCCCWACRCTCGPSWR